MLKTNSKNKKKNTHKKITPIYTTSFQKQAHMFKKLGQDFWFPNMQYSKMLPIVAEYEEQQKQISPQNITQSKNERNWISFVKVL